MRLAVFADVHSNLLALEAVIQDMQSVSPDLVINLGDLVSGPFDPLGSADAQMGLNCPTLAGNHERQLLTDSVRPSDVFARPLLLPQHWKWIVTLPKTLTLLDGEVFACHGSPVGGDTGHLLDYFISGNATLATDEIIRSRLVGIGNAQLVLCAHTHIPRIVICDKVLIVNPGSVGMPDYHDKKSASRSMEASGHRARYALLMKSLSGWSVELRSIAYDYEAAARQAEENGRPDTAFGIRTGRVPSIV